MQINLSSVFIEVENFLFQLLFFLVQFPKTLIKGILNPKWVHNHITDELKKEQHEQFKEYMNPLYFFIVVYVIVNLTASSILGGETQAGTQVFSAQGLAASSISFLLLPIPFSVALIKIVNRSVVSAEYRRTYYMQLIIFGISLVLFILTSLIALPLLAEETPAAGMTLAHTLSLLATLVAFPAFGIWFLVAQTIIFYNEAILAQTPVESNLRKLAKAIGLVALCSLFDIIIFMNSDLIDSVVNTVTQSFGL